MKERFVSRGISELAVMPSGDDLSPVLLRITYGTEQHDIKLDVAEARIFADMVVHAADEADAAKEKK